MYQGEKMARDSFFDRIDDLKKDAVLIQEILKGEIVFVKELEQKYRTKFGNKSTGYQYIRDWFADMKKRGIVTLISTYPLEYELNKDWEVCLKKTLKAIDEISKAKEDAMAKEVIKNRQLRGD